MTNTDEQARLALIAAALLTHAPYVSEIRWGTADAADAANYLADAVLEAREKGKP